LHHLFKSYGGFDAEVDFAYLKSCIGKGMRSLQSRFFGCFWLFFGFGCFGCVEIFSTRKHTAALTSTRL